jgi:hypothetical protein
VIVQYTNGNNVYTWKFIIHVITNPLLLGFYIPCKKESWCLMTTKLKTRVKVEQNRLLMISFQESTWINLGKK